MNTSYTHPIRIKSTRKDGVSTTKEFSIRVLNAAEDLDQDGVEDAYDEDVIDGDGVSNFEERDKPIPGFRILSI